MTYANGPRDAESVLYVAEGGRVYVVSKQFGGAKMYRSPPDVFSRPTAVLKQVANAPAWPPTRRSSRMGTTLSSAATSVPRPTATRLEEARRDSLPSQHQGESITSPPPGDEIWVGSEGERSKVSRYRCRT